MSSGFITESEAVETRKKRQEEWERVRKADDPLERPEEPFDHRSLYERLQEQKQKKDLEYEEAHKLKNMIKGLDDDEIDFLDLVDRTKLAADRRKVIEEELELNDYRNRVATLQEKALDKKLQAENNSVKPKLFSTNRNSQMNLLKGVVVKKNDGKKRKLSDMDEGEKILEKDKIITEEKVIEGNQDALTTMESDVLTPVTNAKRNKFNEESSSLENNKMRCIGILPGLGCYNDSSSDEVSSDSDNDECLSNNDSCDILGRKIIVKEKKGQSSPAQN